MQNNRNLSARKIITIIKKKKIGLYRDDGLATINNSSGRVLDRMRKDIILKFQNEGLSITLETNLIKTDFLDVTLNLLAGKDFPLRNFNSKTLNINAKSKYFYTIIKEFLKMISKTAADLSYNQEEFNKAKPLY